MFHRTWNLRLTNAPGKKGPLKHFNVNPGHQKTFKTMLWSTSSLKSALRKYSTTLLIWYFFVSTDSVCF